MPPPERETPNIRSATYPPGSESGMLVTFYVPECERSIEFTEWFGCRQKHERDAVHCPHFRLPNGICAYMSGLRNTPIYCGQQHNLEYKIIFEKEARALLGKGRRK